MTHYRRIKVRYYDPDKGRNTTHMVADGGPEPSVTKNKLGTFLAFRDQAHHNIHIVDMTLVVSIVLEEQNPKYGTFAKVADWEPHQ